MSWFFSDAAPEDTSKAKSLKDFVALVGSASDEDLNTYLSTLTPAARTNLEKAIAEKEASEEPERKIEPAVEPVNAKPATIKDFISEAVTEEVKKVENLLTEEVKSPVKEPEQTLPSFTAPAAKLELAGLIQLEPAIMQPEPQVVSANSTPMKEEANSTAPATPEPSVAISRPTSMEVTRQEKFTGPAQAPMSSTFGQMSPGKFQKQTSDYARLSTNEQDPTFLEAHSAVSTGTLLTPDKRSKFFVTPTPLQHCGGDRQRLRNEFNMQEITMELIFGKFDLNKNGVLDQSELRKLLQAQASAVHINIDDAVRFVLVVADDNEDGGISKSELSHGLQAWHAFQSMPAEVNRAMKNAGISPDGSRMPTMEELRSLLRDLNGFIEPTLEEVTTVRRVVIAVGGSDDRVTTEQMRMAISVWYTNVERKATTFNSKMQYSLNGWAQSAGLHLRRLIQQLPSTGVTLGIVSVDDLEASLQEEERKHDARDSANQYMPFQENKCSETLGAILWLAIFILPGIFMIHVAEDYPSLPDCEHDLSYLLEWKGYLSLAIGFGGLMYQIVYDGQFRSFCLVVGLTSIVVLMMQEIVGLGYVLFSTPEKCGNYLWNVNAFYFVWSVIWGPCLGCLCICSCFGYFNYQEYQAVELADKKAHEDRTLHHGNPSAPSALE
mmetsp:Transcript_109971/g.173254  ORF Transcript_109971/g.173254 Transcript_109971/m.173254 type:complete len:664 (+) Transcript_109971:73-2064(+)